MSIGRVNIPPIFSPDCYRYLNIIKMKYITPNLAINPWFGTQVAINDVIIYSIFGLALKLFYTFNYIVGDKLYFTLFVWNIFWTALIFISLLCFFYAIGLRQKQSIIFLGLSSFLLIDFTSIQLFLLKWNTGTILDVFHNIRLPYIRPFFPQVATPFILWYLIVLLKVLKKQTAFNWSILFVIQFITFVTYPYAALLIMLTTMNTFIAFTLFVNKSFFNHINGLYFLLLCVIFNTIYIMIRGPLLGYLPLEFSSIIQLNVSQLSVWFGKFVMLLIVLIVICFYLNDEENAKIKYTVISLGTATALLLICDTIINPIYLISFHAYNFINIALIIMSIYILAYFYNKWATKRLLLNTIIWFVSFIIILIGFSVSDMTYKMALPFNKKQSELIRIINNININERVLIIASAEALDSAATWVPLITNAQVLFSRDAHFVLPRNKAYDIYLFRVALYIFMRGKDEAWAKLEMKKPYGLFPSNIALGISGLERTVRFEERIFMPFMVSIEAGNDPETMKLFGGYEKILVIDDMERPLFLRNNLLKYLKIIEQEQKNGFLLLWCKPL